MKSRVILMFLMVFIAGCSTFRRPYVKNTKPAGSEFDKYVLDFEKIIKGTQNSGNGKAVYIEVGDVKKPAVGLCWSTQIPPVVSIDRKYWEKSTELSKESLVFHELGHCACYIGHQHREKEYSKEWENPTMANGFLEDGCPASLMYPYTFSDACYEKHREHYRYELRMQCL